MCQSSGSVRLAESARVIAVSLDFYENRKTNYFLSLSADLRAGLPLDDFYFQMVVKPFEQIIKSS